MRSSGTLYSLSKEGRGSAGPLITALTVAVAEAAEDYAKTQPGGRLAVPMVAVLDEAANVCRWRELPNQPRRCSQHRRGTFTSRPDRACRGVHGAGALGSRCVVGGPHRYSAEAYWRRMKSAMPGTVYATRPCSGA